MGGRKEQEDRLRRRFYKAGADSLVALGVTPAMGGYACPQCCTVFSPQALDTHDLTLEHVPSKQLGGRQVTLTCVKCNPGSGTGLEADVLRQRRMEDFARAVDGTWRGKLLAGDEVETPVTIAWKGGALQVGGHPKLSHPEKQKALEGYLERHVGRNDWKFSLRLPGWNRRRAEVGHLRTAYLAAFAKFGYTVILNPLGQRIRAQIAAPESTEIVGYLARATDPVDPDVRALMVCHTPFQCLSVQMGPWVVILPWPPSGVDPYEAVRELDETTRHVQGQVWPWPMGMELILDKETVAQRGRVKQEDGNAA